MNTPTPAQGEKTAPTAETEMLRRYPGTRPFKDTDEERAIFTGRVTEIADLTRYIISSRLFVLYSKSGMGKTSLLNAGLFPALRTRGYAPLSVRFKPDDSNDAQSIVNKLVHDITEHAREQNLRVHDMPEHPRSFAEVFAQVTFWGENGLMHPVLVLDQFEEVFRLFPHQSREEIARQLSGLLGGTQEVLPTLQLAPPPTGIRVLISQRDDFLGQLLTLRKWLPDLLTHATRLQALTSTQALDAITIPAGMALSTCHTPPFYYSTELQTELIDYLKSVDNDLRDKSPTSDAETVESFVLQVFCEHIENRVIEARQKKQLLSNASSDTLDEAFLGFPKARPLVLRSFYRRKMTSTVVATLVDRITPPAAAPIVAMRTPSTLPELWCYVSAMRISSWRKNLTRLLMPGYLLGGAFFFRRCLWLIEKDLIDRDGGRIWKREVAIKKERKMSNTDLLRLEQSRLLLKADDKNYQISHDKLARAIHENSIVRKLEVLGKSFTMIAVIAFLAWFGWDQWRDVQKQKELTVIAETATAEAVEQSKAAANATSIAKESAKTAYEMSKAAEKAKEAEAQKVVELRAMQATSYNLYCKLAEGAKDPMTAAGYWASAARSSPEKPYAVQELIGAVMSAGVRIPLQLFLEAKTTAVKPRLHHEIPSADSRFFATQTQEGIQSWDSQRGIQVALFKHGNGDDAKSKAYLAASGTQLIVLHPSRNKQEGLTLEWREATGPARELFIPLQDTKAAVTLEEVSGKGRWVCIQQKDTVWFAERDSASALIGRVHPQGIDFTPLPAAAEDKAAKSSVQVGGRNVITQNVTVRTGDEEEIVLGHFIMAPDDSVLVVEAGAAYVESNGIKELRLYREPKSFTVLKGTEAGLKLENLQFGPNGSPLYMNGVGDKLDQFELRPLSDLQKPGKRFACFDPLFAKVGLVSEISMAEFSTSGARWLSLTKEAGAGGICGTLWDAEGIKTGVPKTLWSASDGAYVSHASSWLPLFNDYPQLSSDGRFCLTSAVTGDFADGTRILHNPYPEVFDGDGHWQLLTEESFPTLSLVSDDHTVTHLSCAPVRTAREDGLGLRPTAGALISVDQLHVLSATQAGHLDIWDIKQDGLSHSKEHKFERETVTAGIGHDRYLITVRESSYSDKGADAGHAAIYDMQTWERTAYLDEKHIGDGVDGEPVAITASKDGRRLIVLTDLEIAHGGMPTDATTISWEVEDHLSTEGLRFAVDLKGGKLFHVRKDGSIWVCSWAHLLAPFSTNTPATGAKKWLQVLPPPALEVTDGARRALELSLKEGDIAHFAYGRTGRLSLLLNSRDKLKPVFLRAAMKQDGTTWEWLPHHQLDVKQQIEAAALTDDGNQLALLSDSPYTSFSDELRLQLFALPTGNEQALAITPPVFVHPTASRGDISDDGEPGSMPTRFADGYQGPLPFTPSVPLSESDYTNQTGGMVFLPGTEEVIVIRDDSDFRVDLGAWKLEKWDQKGTLVFADLVNDLYRTDWKDLADAKPGWNDPGSYLRLRTDAKENALMNKLVEWLLEPYGKGMISPVSKTEFSTWAQTQAEKRTPDYANRALAVDPFNPLAMAWHAYFKLQEMESPLAPSQHAWICALFHYARQYVAVKPDTLGEVLMLEAVCMLEMGDFTRAQKACDAFKPPVSETGHWPQWAKVIAEVKTALQNSKLPTKDPKKYEPRLKPREPEPEVPKPPRITPRQGPPSSKKSAR